MRFRNENPGAYRKFELCKSKEVEFCTYTPIHCVKFSVSSGDLLEYNGSQGANELD